MPFGGKKFKRYWVWVRKKRIQVKIRTELSHWLAIGLAILIVIREWKELVAFLQWIYFLLVCHGLVIVGEPPTLFGIFVLLLTTGTVWAAFWELYGNKLTTSPQEIRFVTGIRTLLLELERLVHGSDVQSPTDELSRFAKGFLTITTETLCGPHKVDAGIMYKMPSNEALQLTEVSELAHYTKGLEIPLPTEASPKTGPAGVSFQQVSLVYVPHKHLKEAWPFRLIVDDGKESYEPSEPVIGWIPSSSAEEEDFESGLCVPIAVYSQKGQKTRYGVLNFSTKANDPFMDRDFMMAECFASVLSHAVAVTRRKLEQK
jgi:hypothetical protein